MQTPRMGKPCGPTCRKKCWDRIPEDRRKELFQSYWNITYMEKRSFIFHTVSQQETKRQTSAGPSKRKKSLSYQFIDNLGQAQDVCKTFYLTTIGYHPKNDRLIQTVIGNSTPSSLTPSQERRGKQTPPNTFNMAPIHEHIESFNPTISHYRREHAPMRRYLPSDITVKLLYTDFKEKHNIKCSDETYRKEVKLKNISYAKLGEEQCEHCLLHDVHTKAEHQATANLGDNNPDQDCPICQKWEDHKLRVGRGRHHYKADAAKEQTDDLSIRSVDLQKVIMLPRMPGVKTAVFTKRISIFH